ncbi:MAG: sugar ABC transporter permease, partial [Clostridia bacterium]|nr:sugar ABC transporter permease [Clostridia bacterium]
MTDLEYFKLSNPQKMLRAIGRFFAHLPRAIADALKKLGLGIVWLFQSIGKNIADIFTTFRDGDWKTRLSYLIMGFGSCARGQWGRGILFFLFQTVFN